ncbi:tRNA (N6-isopentenyl adenosine(37)-C2)-methylthiotransferase MiaB, partial [bacterium]|nr:tRNA (N6-isopentenyl adenosine(37)-C2)-methylthiotransferase MiaB [bacterium]
MKVYLKTYGCQMNVYDSEIMAGLLLVKGYEIAEDMNEADIILLNTCSIRKKA